jgi:hypothetical protein
VEPVCESVGAGDAGDGVANTGFISSVDPQPIATEFIIDVDLTSVDPEFMSEYEVTFGDERVDSVDD